MDEARREGALAMKARILESVRAAHARDTGYDPHGPEEECKQCAIWHDALKAIALAQ